MRKIEHLLAFLFLLLLTSCNGFPGINSNTIPSSRPTNQINRTPMTTVKTSRIGDGGLIAGNPCPAPCFFEVEIGKTPFSAVVKTLHDNGIENCVEADNNVKCGLMIIIGTHSSDRIIDSIGFSTEEVIGLEAIIQKFGDPDIIRLFPGDVPEKLELSAQLFWNSINMRIDLPTYEGQVYKVEKTAQIKWITYFNKGLYSQLVSSGNPQVWRDYVNTLHKKEPSRRRVWIISLSPARPGRARGICRSHCLDHSRGT